MLSEMEAQFRSSEAYEAAKAAGYDYSERTLRSDLNAMERVGVLMRTGNDSWQKLTGHTAPAPLRIRIALALLSASRWERTNTSGPYKSKTRFFGPSATELTEKVNEYAALLRGWQ